MGEFEEEAGGHLDCEDSLHKQKRIYVRDILSCGKQAFCRHPEDPRQSMHNAVQVQHKTYLSKREFPVVEFVESKTICGLEYLEHLLRHTEGIQELPEGDYV